MRLRFAGTVACMLFPLSCFGQVASQIDASIRSGSQLDERVDAIVADGIAAGEMPGCVVCVGTSEGVQFRKAYGLRQVEPSEIPMTTDAVFDLASLTKPIATATSIMLLIEDGKLGLNDEVAKSIPEFAANGKEEVTVFDLLTHQSGLIADNPIADYAGGRETAMRRVFDLTLRSPRRTKFTYSDVNFIVLGELVRRVSGSDLNSFSRDRIFGPLEMGDTCFLPPEQLRERAVPTERTGERWLRGEVHDPRAAKLDGVAGHAGLFSTGDDLSLYARMMSGRGELNGTRIMSEKTFDFMTRPYEVPGGLRGLGWDKRTGYSSNRGKLMSDAAFGHGGFTGTVLWVDPELDVFVVFLSSRLHPDGKGSINPLAGRIVDAAVEELCGVKE